MHIKEKNINEIVVTYEVSKEEFALALDKAYEKVSKDVAIKGFRKGKAPKSVFLAHYGEKSLYSTAIEEIATEKVFDKEIDKEYSDRFMSQPALDLDSDIDFKEGFTYTMTYQLIPKVKLAEYKGIEIDTAKYEATEDQINHKKDLLLTPYKTEELVTDGAKYDDTLITDCLISSNEGEIMNETNYEFHLTKNPQMASIVSPLIGALPNSEHAFEAKAPNAKNEEATINCHFKVYEVKRTITPEITDELVATIDPECQNEAEWTAKIKAEINNENAPKLKDAYFNEIISKVIELSVFHFDVDMFNSQFEEHFKQMTQGLDDNQLEEIFAQQGSSLKEFKQMQYDRELTGYKASLVLHYIKKAENIEPDFNEVKEIYKLAKKADPKKTLDDVYRDEEFKIVEKVLLDSAILK